MTRRSYSQYCGLAKALDLVGERWTLLIVRNLLLGPLRYSDLLRGLPGLTTNLLAKRLKEMEAHGLIEKTRLSPSDRSFAYRLTGLGHGLEPAIHALGRWGGHAMAAPEPEDERRLEWLLVSLKRRYQGGVDLSAEVIADEVPYQFVLTQESVDIQRGSVPNPVLRLRAKPEALARLFVQGLPPEGLSADVQLDGGSDDLETLVAAFSTP